MSRSADAPAHEQAGLPFARDNDALAAMLAEIGSDCGEPFFLSIDPCCLRRWKLRVDVMRNTARETFYFSAAKGQPVLSHRAGDRRRAFDDVQPVHFAFAGAESAVGEFSRITEPLRMRVKKIGFERHNHLCLIEAIVRFDNFAERLPRALANVVTGDRIKLMPLRFRKYVRADRRIARQALARSMFR